MMKIFHSFKRTIVSLIVLCLSFLMMQNLLAQSTQATAADRGLAEEEFRRGVQAYYRGSFNDAILQFEKALSYLPNENLIIDWLGKSYYKSGIEGSAITQWNYALENGYGGLLLQNKLEIIRQRRITGSDIDASAFYTEAGSFLGIRNNELQFAQPVSLLPNSDGSCWVLAYTSNELIKIDINGSVLARIRGPLVGFDRPMDIIRLSNGNLLISEYMGNRLSFLDSNGNFIKSFGSTGRGRGQLVGPQYLAEGEDGTIFTTDFGNARVVAFDVDGNPLFEFGNASSSFDGLKAPTGIAYVNGSIYVADAVTGAIYQFDSAGNYLDIFVPEGTFTNPECIRQWEDYLIVSDTNRVLLISLSDGSVIEKANTGNAPSRVTCAVPDANGNLLVADFKSNEIYIMAKMTELVGGLFVQVERVISDYFPNITLEVSVQNRSREPIVGLKEVNFLVTEEQRPSSSQRLLGSADQNTVCDLAIIIDRSIQNDQYQQAIQSALQDIATSMNGNGNITIISAGSIPAIEFTGSSAAATSFSISSLSTPTTNEVSLDLAIRLAANGLINGEKKRAIVLLTGAKSVSRNAFSRYGLSDLTSYINNNSMSFLTVYMTQNALPDELSYITTQTKGGSYYVFRPEGISCIINDILQIPVGLYQLSYTSSLPTNFGQAYLSVEVEAYLFNQSGRDETGYYAPLE